MPGCQSGFAMKLPGSSPLTNGTMIDTKTLCSRLLPFQTGKIVLTTLSLKLREYLLIKNCTLLRWESNFLGAVQLCRFFLPASLQGRI